MSIDTLKDIFLFKEDPIKHVRLIILGILGISLFWFSAIWFFKNDFAIKTPTFALIVITLAISTAHLTAAYILSDILIQKSEFRYDVVTTYIGYSSLSGCILLSSGILSIKLTQQVPILFVDLKSNDNFLSLLIYVGFCHLCLVGCIAIFGRIAAYFRKRKENSDEDENIFTEPPLDKG